jgi:hypothetical protein
VVKRTVLFYTNAKGSSLVYFLIYSTTHVSVLYLWPGRDAHLEGVRRVEW